MSETIVSYDGDLRCRAEHADTGTVVLTDAPKDHHGLGEGFSPSEMLSIALGSCILSMMALAARATGADMAGATAAVTKDMADAPRRIAGMAVTVRVPGRFDARQRARLEAAAHACPVHEALGIDVPITIRWEA